MKIACYKCKQKLDVSDLQPFTKINCPECNTMIIVPQQFGNILLEEDLGRGRLANVYRAMDITLDREVAVKVLKDELLNTNLSEGFINEARSASAVNHPNVIPIYSCGEIEGKPYVTMQYMEGGSFRRILEAGKTIDSYAACKWFEDVVNAIDSASRHGVSHYDIKPSNVFLDIDGNVKVGDFGIGRVLDSGRPLFENDKVSPEVTLETSYYISPEKISTGKHNMAAEIYSIGASMYHMLCGRAPFCSDDPATNVRARFEGPVAPPEDLRNDVDLELAELIKRMLSIYPSDRPKSYNELTQALSAIRNRLKESGSPAPQNVIAEKPKEEFNMSEQEEEFVEERPRKKSQKVVSSSNGRKVNNRPEYFVRKNFAYYIGRLIPLSIITFCALLLIAHFKPGSAVAELMSPVLEYIEKTNGSLNERADKSKTTDATDDKSKTTDAIDDKSKTTDAIDDKSKTTDATIGE